MHEKLIHRNRKNLDASVAATKWTSRIAEGLEKQAREVGYEGRLSQQCLDELQTFLTGLLKAQHDHLWHNVQDRKAVHDFAKLERDRRDELAKEVYGQLVELRGTIRSLVGKGLERKLFGAGKKTPREPWELARVAHNVTRFLSEPSAQEGLCKGLATEALWKAAVEKMSEPLAGLWDVLHEIQGMENDEAAAVDRLHEAKTRHHQTQKHLFRLQESVCALAGHEDLAQTLRPTEPARRKRPKERGEGVESRQNAQGAGRKPTEVTPNAPGAAPETAKTGLDAFKAVPEEAASLGTGTHPVTSSKAPPETDSHPVRKVLKWFQAVPHRVRDVPESPETAGSEGRAA